MTSVGVMASGVTIATGITRPSIVGTASVFPAPNTAGTATTIAIPTPASAAIGESLVACLTSSGQTATDITLPSGWSRIGLPAINDPGVRILGWFFMPISATPASSYSFTSPIAGRFGGVMYRVQNANPTQPHKFWNGYGSKTGALVDVFSLNTTNGNLPTEDSLYLMCCNEQVTVGNAATVDVQPTGFTVLTSTYFGLDSGSRSGLHTWQRNISAGAVVGGTLTLTVNPSSAGSNGVVLRGV